MAQDSGIIKEGWLYREEVVAGSMSTWKKRWNLLTLQKLCCYKHNNATEPISSVSVASVEEMAYGNIADKTYAFSLTTPRGIVRLAAESEEDREGWVATLRALVPKAKVELAKEMLMRKAKRKANLELAQQQIKEAIESILRDSKRVAVRGGFKTYADALAECFQGLLKAVDQVSELGLNSAKQCAYAISSIVDSANSAAAICTNKAIQDEIVVRTRDIAVETANLLGYATTAAHDTVAQNKMYECIASIQDQVQQILELLAAAGKLQQELDDAKQGIEEALNGPRESTFVPETSVEANVEAITEKAKILSTQIKNIAQNATIQPERVGEFSKEAAQLMCELLDATNIVAKQMGVDPNDPEYLAGAGDISEHKKQQLESMLAAAKGFAAATTNMIDLLKQIPQQEDDENLQFRLAATTRSADNALNAFMNITTDIDTSPNLIEEDDKEVAGGADFPDYETEDTIPPELDAENELLQALQAIEESVLKLAQPQVGAQGQVGQLGQMSQMQNQMIAESGASGPILNAARSMGEATARLVKSAAEAQQHMKETGELKEVYRKDPNWSRGLIASAQSVAETTNQLVEVAIDPNTTPEDIVAAARCVNGATARLIAFSRAKGDPDSASMQAVNSAAKAIAQATNQLVNAAKQQKYKEDETLSEEELSKMRDAPRTRQIRAEFEAQARIAKLEAELDAARQYLFKLRRAVYGSNPAGSKSRKGGSTTSSSTSSSSSRSSSSSTAVKSAVRPPVVSANKPIRSASPRGRGGVRGVRGGAGRGGVRGGAGRGMRAGAGAGRGLRGAPRGRAVRARGRGV